MPSLIPLKRSYLPLYQTRLLPWKYLHRAWNPPRVVKRAGSPRLLRSSFRHLPNFYPDSKIVAIGHCDMNPEDSMTLAQT